MTEQRRVILEELKQLYSHPTAEELHRIVRRRLPRISLATVYRNLEILCDGGLAQKIDTAGAQRRFDGNTLNHYHVRCTTCGRVEDLPLRPLPMIEETARTLCGYEVVSHRVEIIGICPDCRVRGNRDSQITS
jgi:Fur family ferric uptake transcriptional regulator